MDHACGLKTKRNMEIRAKVEKYLVSASIEQLEALNKLVTA